jgi:hypothetical protein
MAARGREEAFEKLELNGELPRQAEIELLLDSHLLRGGNHWLKIDAPKVVKSWSIVGQGHSPGRQSWPREGA